MHIPLATLRLTSLELTSWRLSRDNLNSWGTMKHGSSTNCWLKMSCPEANRTPLYCSLLCKYFKMYYINPFSSLEELFSAFQVVHTRKRKTYYYNSKPCPLIEQPQAFAVPVQQKEEVKSKISTLSWKWKTKMSQVALLIFSRNEEKKMRQISMEFAIESHK